MNHNEQTALLATRILGLTREEWNQANPGPTTYIVRTDGVLRWERSGPHNWKLVLFNPRESWADAGLLHDALVKRGYKLRLECDPTFPWISEARCQIFTANDYGTPEVRLAFEAAHTMPEAIYLAAVALTAVRIPATQEVG